MSFARFMVIGQDKGTLSAIKNMLTANGFVFIGYSSSAANILRLVQTLQPDLVVIEAPANLRELKQALEVIEDELLAACILLLETRNDDILGYIRESRLLSYLTRPVQEEALLQVAEVMCSTLRRTREYEERIRKLNSTIESRRLIEKAKWILVEQDGLNEAEAYEAINRKSRDNRITMRATAEAIILARGDGSG